MYDDDGDDELEMNEPGDGLLYSSEELCQYAFEALEKAHPVKITEIKYSCDGFEFSISADLTKRMPLPKCWTLRPFGDGIINFGITLDDFQHIYHKLENRTFIDTARVAIERVYGKVCDIISIEEVEEPIFEGALDVVVRLKPGCRFETWLDVKWVEGDRICFEIDHGTYNDLIESEEYRNLFR